MGEPIPGPLTWDAGLPTDEHLEEHAYLVARGVRPMALAGTCEADPVTMLRAQTRLGTAGQRHDALPFVIDHGDGRASCGYAACEWVIDLYQWAWAGDLPKERRHQITGLLLGYSAEAIARHGEQTGRRFQMPDVGDNGDRDH